MLYARSGDHTLRMVVQRAAVSTMFYEPVRFMFNILANNSFGCSRRSVAVISSAVVSTVVGEMMCLELGPFPEGVMQRQESTEICHFTSGIVDSHAKVK